MMLCSKTIVGFQLWYCSLEGSSSLSKKEDREKGRIKVCMRKSEGAVTPFEEKIERGKEGVALLFSLSSAKTKDTS